MNKKVSKLSVVIGILAILSTIGLAAWMIFAESSFTGQVTSTSGSPVIFSAEFQDFSLDTTTSNASDSTVAVLTNDNGDLQLTADINITRTDVSDDCIDYENDCDISILVENHGYIVDQDVVNLVSGDSDVTAEIVCDKLSCPQDIEVSLTLSE